MLTKEEWQEFSKAFHEWNGDFEEYSPDYCHMDDFSVYEFTLSLLIDFYTKNA